MSSNTSSDDSEIDCSTHQPMKRTWPFKGAKEPALSHEEPEPKAKKKRTEVISSIRTALESEKPQHGILNYFKKATESESAAYQARMAEEIATRMEETVWREGAAKRKKHASIQRQARERKQTQRRREKDREILAGLRSPGGTKHQARQVSLVQLSSLHSRS